MQRQNKEQAEQLVAEVLAAACLVVEDGAGSAKDRSVVHRVLLGASEALRSRQISVHAHLGAQEVILPNAEGLKASPHTARKIVMRKRGRQVVLDLARLQSHAALMTMGRWCKSALRSNFLRAFKLLGQPEIG